MSVVQVLGGDSSFSVFLIVLHFFFCDFGQLIFKNQFVSEFSGRAEVF